jgi:hypothetical protein
VNVHGSPLPLVRSATTPKHRGNPDPDGLHGKAVGLPGGDSTDAGGIELLKHRQTGVNVAAYAAGTEGSLIHSGREASHPTVHFDLT